jgi:hypothetical protein
MYFLEKIKGKFKAMTSRCKEKVKGVLVGLRIGEPAHA